MEPLSTVAVGVLAICSLSSLIHNGKQAKQIARLKAESALALEDDGLLAQIETAAALGSKFARELLESATTTERRPRLPPHPEGVTAKLSSADFRQDFNACQSDFERLATLRRWHGKGYRLSASERQQLLKIFSEMSDRNAVRRVLDEQEDPTWPRISRATATQ